MAVLAFTLAAPPASANPRLEVRGRSRFEAEARPSSGELVVFGSLLDDTGHALGDMPMTVSLTASNGQRLLPHACDSRTTLAVAEGDTWRLTTGPDGSFCVRAPPAHDDANGPVGVELAWGGRGLVDGAKTELSVDPSRATVKLALDPEPGVVLLGQGALKLTAVTRISAEDGERRHGSRPITEGLTLELSDERGKVLDEKPTDESGTAHFVVEEAALGLPGPGELRLSFRGSAVAAPASHDAPYERRTRVFVSPGGVTARDSANAAIDGVIEDDAVGLDIDATTTSGAPVPGGSVEGLVDGVVAGAAPIAGGHAHLVIGWHDRRQSQVMLRYVPGVAWYLAGDPLAVTVRITPTPFWRTRTTGLIAAGVAMVVLFLRLRARASRRRPTSAPRADELISTTFPRLEVLAPQVDGRRAWEGRVVDAHDGAAIGGAWVALERAGFTGSEIVARTDTDPAGAFKLEVSAVLPGDRLVVEGLLHERLTRGAPKFGLVAIALVSRRRALLTRFVRWARAKGGLYDLAPEPTPEHVRRVAATDGTTVRWAGAVEKAAFGPREVDAGVETEVNALGPDQAEDLSAPGRRTQAPTERG